MDPTPFMRARGQEGAHLVITDFLKVQLSVIHWPSGGRPFASWPIARIDPRGPKPANPDELEQNAVPLPAPPSCL
jgi:hypothetical protein